MLYTGIIKDRSEIQGYLQAVSIAGTDSKFISEVVALSGPENEGSAKIGSNNVSGKNSK